MKVGFIGLGRMGSNMVLNLLDKKLEVVVWNRSKGRMDKVVSEGAEGAEGVEGSDDHQIGDFRDQMVALDSADEAMMDWMRNFIANHEGWEHDSIMSYLTDENARVREVGEIIEKTIAKTNDLLDQE